MKQILIEKNDSIENLYGTEIPFRQDNLDVSFPAGIPITLYFDLNLKPISGKGTFDIWFRPAEALAIEGVALLGTYRNSKNQVAATFIALKPGQNVGFEKGNALLIGTLFEPVSYRQIETSVADGTVNVVESEANQSIAIEPTPPKKRGRKKN